MRVTQTRPGAAALGRTLGLVAPTAATGSSAPMSRSSPRCAQRPAGRRSRTSPRSGRTTSPRRTGSPNLAAVAPGRAAVVAAGYRPPARLDRPAGAGRSPWLGHRGRAPAEDRRATAGGRRRVLAARDRASSTGARSALRAEPSRAVAATARPPRRCGSGPGRHRRRRAPSPPRPGAPAGGAGSHPTPATRCPGCGTQSGAPASADAAASTPCLPGRAARASLAACPPPPGPRRPAVGRARRDRVRCRDRCLRRSHLTRPRADAGRLPGHRVRDRQARHRDRAPRVGDAGCDDDVLNPTAIGLDASGKDQEAPVRLYLYIFRNREAYARLRSAIDGCARSFVTDPETFELIESSPFVLAGQGPWAPEFKATLREALTVASGTGD